MATKTDTASESIYAPTMEHVEIVTFAIEGISPLLQNNPKEFIGSGGQEKELTAKSRSYDDAQEAELRQYRDGDGLFYHPSVAFTKAILRAVTGKKFGSETATSLVKGTVFIAEPHCILCDGKGKPLKKYTIDRQSVVIGKARILRCRPRFDIWFTKLALEINTGILSADNVRDALSLAGRVVGIGDYRPEKTGGYGRFRVL